jgi:RHS repeat-associated protein
VLDTAHEIAIDSPTRREVVLTNPGTPGLEVHIPAGVTITDVDGRPVHQVGITPIPVTRTPIPMPRGVQVPVFYTVQPAGGSLHGGAARLVYPNYLHQKPGTAVNFWHYEKGGDGWEVYGGGRVDGHGRQVQPLPGSKLYDFDGAMINVTGWVDDLLKPLKDATGKDGDPVDLGTGLFGMTQTDLTLNDALPLALTRAYNSGSGRTRAAGIGMHHNYDLYISSDNQYQEADLNLADGSQIHFVRTSPGGSFADAIMTAAPAPTDFAGSTLAWNGNGWDLVMADGTTLVFGDVAPLQSIRDRYGNQTTIIRDHLNFFGGYEGDVQAVRSTNGLWLSFSYGATAPDGRSLLTRVDDNAGRHVSYGYDTTGRLASVTDPATGITRYGYDSASRLTTVTDPRNVTYLTNHYDANGRVDTQTVNGGSYAFSYTLTAGKVTQTQVTDPLGHIRKVSYDAAGYLVSDTGAFGTPAAQTLTVTRDPTTHIPTDFADPLGHTIRSNYDPVGRPLASTHALGTPNALSSSATFTAPFHQPDTVTDPAGKVSHFSYDPDTGNLAGAADPLGHGGSATYRPDGQHRTVTTPAHETSTLGYTADGQLTSVTDPAGRQTTVFRDAANRPSVATGPDGLRTVTRYDPLNLVRQTTDPAGAVTAYDYDENGNLKVVSDAMLHATRFDYDDFGQLLTRTDPLNHTDTYTYDALGNVLTHTDRRGLLTEYRQDEAGRLTFVGYGRTGTAAPFSYDSTVTYTWDAADRLKTVTDSAPGAGTISYDYDELDRVKTRTDARGTITYGYDTAGRLARTSVSGQPDVTYGYDNASRLTTITKGTQTATYTLDDAGRPTLAALPGGVSVATTYGPAGDVATLTYKRGTTVIGDLTYRYNVAGLRVGTTGTWSRLALPAAETGAVYDAANRLTAVNGRTLTYDNEGNLTADGPSTYTWNTRGELTAVADTTGTASMAYDADGQLAKVSKAGVDTLFRYDSGDLVTQQAGTAVTSYLPNPAGDGALTRTDAAGTQTFLADAQDSTLALTNATGQLVASYTYDPFGKAASDLSSDPNAVRYTGRPSSPDIPGGLQYNNARFYSPTLHRFISQDPMPLSLS